MDLKEKCKKLPILTKRHVEWNYQKEGEPLQLPFPLYDEEVFKWMKTMRDEKLLIYSYSSQMEDIREKEVSSLSIDEILTYYTGLIKGERFCDGLIAEALEDGTLEALGNRLKELV